MQPKASNELIRLHVLIKASQRRKKKVTPSCFPVMLQKAGQVKAAQQGRGFAYKTLVTAAAPSSSEDQK